MWFFLLKKKSREKNEIPQTKPPAKAEAKDSNQAKNVVG
jgi:hypothetical protein